MSDMDLSEFEDMFASERAPCRVANALDELPKPDLALVTEALLRVGTKNTPGQFRPGRVSAWFAKRGHRVSPSAVVNHRDGKCRCHA